MAPKRTRGGTSKEAIVAASSTDPMLSNHGFRFRDEEHKARYNTLITRTLKPSRFACSNTLKDLGLFDDVKYMFDNYGIWDYVKKTYVTHVELSLEFFSSVEMVHEPGGPYMRFRLLDKEYSLYPSEFNAIMGFPNNNGIHVRNQRFHKEHMWRILTSHDYTDSGNIQSSLIWNPVVKFVQILMSSMLYPRGESTRLVNMKELYLIWFMLFGKKEGAPSPDIGREMMRHLASQGTKKSGNLAGGFIATILAKHFKLKIPSSMTTLKPKMLDINTLMAMSFLTRVKQDDTFVNLLSYPVATNPLIFPNTERTTIHNLKNLTPPLIESAVRGHPQQTTQEPHPNTNSELHQIRVAQNELRDLYGHLQVQVNEISSSQNAIISSIDRLQATLDHMMRMQEATYNYHASQGHYPPLDLNLPR